MEKVPYKGFGLTAVIIVIAAAALLGGGLWYARTTYFVAPAPQEPVACTKEAKQCPDGSYVGRTGPNCQFAACPSGAESQIDTSEWKTYRNEEYGFELRYPESLVTTDTFGTIANVGLQTIYFRNPEVIPSPPRFFVRVSKSNGMSLETWIQENHDAYLYDSDTSFSKKDPVTIDGIHGLIIGEPLDPAPNPIVFLPKDNLIFIIGFFAREDENILSTLRFIK